MDRRKNTTHTQLKTHTILHRILQHSLGRGYIPLLSNFTFEDKAAKGLRKRNGEDKPEPAVHFSALELVRDNRILFLSGPSGSGKTSFAKHLCFRLSTSGAGTPRPLIRNENGAVYEEHWDEGPMVSCYFNIYSPDSLKAWIDEFLTKLLEVKEQTTNPRLLIILDSVENARDDGPVILLKILTLIEGFENIRLLFLGESSHVKHWALPSKVVRHELLPLLAIQRRQALIELSPETPSQTMAGSGAPAANPAYFALALEANHPGDQPEDLLDGADKGYI